MELDDIQTITVLGAGTMGHGIAEVAALAGYDVNLRDINDELVTDGYEQIEWSLNKLAENDRISEEDATDSIERITPLVDLEESVEETDVVIEAIVERMDIKQEVYEELSEYAPEHAIFASNTSSLSITDLADVTDRPEKVCGMHFFNPPVRMELVEVISGANTSDETMDVIVELAESFDKTPVRVRKDKPGFIVNSILVPLMNEACWIVEEDVATIREVDSTTKYDIGLPMGAFELGDQVGNDVTLHVLNYMYEVLGDAYEPSPVLVRTVENDKLGKKTGEGFYDYDNGGADVPADQQSEEVKARLIATLANETGKLIEKGVAPPADIDKAVKLGAAFPNGSAKECDEYGLAKLVEKLDELYEETGAARYEVSDGLREAADEGGFYGESEEEEDGHEFEAVQVEYPTEMVGHIILDRPHQLNTVNPAMLDDVEAALELFEEDDDIRAVLITGAGDRAFSAGADAMGMAGSANPIDAVNLSRRGQEVWGKLEEVPMPVVAGIDGFCLGGGMELSMCADMRIASERSEFGQPEFNLGLLPGWGGTQRLSNIVGEGIAKEIIFTAERYEAEAMEGYGFVNEVVDNEELEEAAVELADDLARGPPIAMEYTKRAMLAGRDDTDAGLETEAFAFGHLVGTDDVMEGITKFMGDEEPEFQGK